MAEFPATVDCEKPDVEQSISRLAEMVRRFLYTPVNDIRFGEFYVKILRHMIAFLEEHSDLDFQQESRFKNDVIDPFFRFAIGARMDLPKVFQDSLDIEEDWESDKFAKIFNIRLRASVEALFAEINKEIGTRDPLTGLLTRGIGVKALEAVYARSCSKGNEGNVRSMGILFVDFDRFKRVNDTYGHAIGDNVLIAGSMVGLSESIRPSDILARWGGEEFVVGLCDVNFEEAVIIAQRMAKNVTDAVQKLCPEFPGNQTISVGLAFLPYCKNINEVRDLIQPADDAVLGAKENGRNCIVFVDQNGKLQKIVSSNPLEFEEVFSDKGFLNTLRRVARTFKHFIVEEQG